MPLKSFQRLLGWAKREAKRRGMAMSTLLAELRTKIRNEVLAEDERSEAS